MILAAVLVLAAVAGAAAFFLLGGDDSKTESVAQAMGDAGCTYKTFEGEPSGVHIANPAATPKEWNSFPPTSGPHFGQWVIWGEYDEPVRLAQAVHNLEHGGIVMYYGSDVPDEEITKLRSFYRSDPAAMLLSPLPQARRQDRAHRLVRPDGGRRGQIDDIAGDPRRVHAIRRERVRVVPRRVPVPGPGADSAREPSARQLAWSRRGGGTGQTRPT